MREPYFVRGKVTSFNFEPKPVEEGLSVSRRSFTTPAQLISLAPPDEEFGIAEMSVGEVRQWGREWGLDVIENPTEEDPGHALIIPGQKLHSHQLRRRLKKARFVAPPEITTRRAPS